MSSLLAPSGRAYAPLPIDGDKGFPQAFPVVFGGSTYRFRLYVDASPALLGDPSAIFDLPQAAISGQQRLLLTGFHAGERFTLSFAGKTTTPITYAVDGAALATATQNALTANLTAGATIIVAPTAAPETFALTFGGDLSGMALAPVTGVAVAPATGTVETRYARALPAREMFLVARVDQDLPTGDSRLVFLRKVVPGLDYGAGNIALTFPIQRVAVRNLNGRGAFGSKITGGIAPRWA